jgi:sugar phosphate isomerase/epimerase
MQTPLLASGGAFHVPLRCFNKPIFEVTFSMDSHLLSRRRFLALSAATVAASSSLARAYPLGRPLGMQLYSVRTLLPQDFAGTLKKVGALGYKEVEAAGFYDHSVEDVKSALQAAGLSCVSAHYALGALKPKVDETLAYCKSLGLEYIVCSSPMRQPGAEKGELTLDDWKWVADQFNQIGEKANAAGLKFAYHNHTHEFTAIDGTLPWELLVKNTDPAKVNFEMDCGWVIVAGQDPIPFLKKYPKRIVMLHVKDFKDKKPPSVPLGTGDIDYKPIFAAAKGASIRHVFVEQEESPTTMLESLAIDAKYMAQFK